MVERTADGKIIIRVPQPDYPPDPADRPCRLCGGIVPGWLLDSTYEKGWRNPPRRAKPFVVCSTCNMRPVRAKTAVERFHDVDFTSGNQGLSTEPGTLGGNWYLGNVVLKALEREIAEIIAERNGRLGRIHDATDWRP